MNRLSHASLATIQDFLLKLDFSSEESAIYLTLAQNEQLTILHTARKSGIERTKIYRLVDELIRRGIIEEVVGYKKKLLKASNINTLSFLVQQQEATTNYLKHTLPLISKELEALTIPYPETKVLYYRGSDGIKQMLWNQLTAKKEILSFTYRVLEEVVGKKFFRSWVDEFEKRNLGLREIRTEEFYKSLDQLKTKTVMNTNQIRYLPSKTLLINHGMDIYNNVYAIYDWREGEIFGVEIYNQKIADMQKHFFEVFWNMAKEDVKALALLKKTKNIR